MGETPGAMRITRKDFLKIGGTGLAGAALLGTAGCGVFEGGGGEQGGGGGGSSVTVNLGDTIRDLNTTTTTDTVSSDVLLNVISCLYRLDPDQQPIPDMAEGVEISSDKLTYVFTIRDGVKWSNGDPVTANDFEFAWLRALDPETAGQYAYIISTFVEGAAEFNEGNGSAEDVAINATDDKTLEVKLVAPSPFWLGLTSFYTYSPQNQAYVEEQGDQYAQNAGSLIYNGPYILEEFDPTQGVTMVKNDDYWDSDTVDIQRVEGRIVKELDTAVNLYESGELDETEIQGQFVDEFRGTPDFWSQTYFATFWMSFNEETVPLFQNVNVRKALQIGFDRDALTAQILNDGSESATGYVPEGIAGPGDETFREAVGPTAPTFNPEEARRLFEQGVEEEGGENPQIELLAYDDSVARDIATFLQSQLQDNLGMKINVNVQPFDRKLELEANGEFQLSWQGWIADYNDPMTFLDYFLSDSPLNTGSYSNAEFDELITQAQEESDFARRMQLMMDAEELFVAEDAGIAPMYFEGEVHLVRPTITNFVDHKYGAGLDARWWKLEG